MKDSPTSSSSIFHHLNRPPPITPSSYYLWPPLTSIAISANICSGYLVHPESSFLQHCIPSQNSPHHIATSIGKYQKPSSIQYGFHTLHWLPKVR